MRLFISNNCQRWDYTFVAHYSEPRKVTFNALNGTIYGGSTKEYTGIIEGQKFGNFYAYPEEPVSNDSNMTFEGWYRDEALTEKADKEQILGTVVNEDIVFYAKYVPTFTVTFYANGGAFKNNAAATGV